MFARSGNAGNTIVANGAIIGTWAHRLDGSVAVRYFEPATAAHRRLVDESVDRYLAGAGDTIVRPRFPAPLQRELMQSSPDTNP